ncbi:MAG: hypothetical protein IKP86_04670 [Anaerolineaceae bacterium]|nr:hypothetical protein [Anaerolineaceae bacterium]
MKKISLLFVLLVLVSCMFSTSVQAKGGLGDNDAFSAYYGKTKSEVRKIAPSLSEWEDGFYIVDAVSDEDEILAILLKFDKYNVVDGVIVLVTSGILKDLDLENSLVGAGTIGLITLGFEADDIKRTSTENDNLYLYLRSGIYVGVTELYTNIYMITALQN